MHLSARLERFVRIYCADRLVETRMIGLQLGEV
jgi:hypothetical protein